MKRDCINYIYNYKHTTFMLEEKKNNNQVMNFKIVVTNLHRKDDQPVS